MRNMYNIPKTVALLVFAIGGYILTLSPNPRLKEIGKPMVYSSAAYVVIEEIAKHKRKSQLESKLNNNI